MIEVFFLGVSIGVVGIILYAFWLVEQGYGECHYKRAVDEIDAEHLQARRAMNDAAGQSWRNLADDDRA